MERPDYSEAADALRDTTLPLFGLDGRFTGRRWVQSWDGRLESVVLAHGDEDSSERVDVGVADWPRAASGTRPVGARWVDVPESLATQVYFARWSPAGVMDADVRDEARALWNEAREAAQDTGCRPS